MRKCSDWRIRLGSAAPQWNECGVGRGLADWREKMEKGAMNGGVEMGEMLWLIANLNHSATMTLIVLNITLLPPLFI